MSNIFSANLQTMMGWNDSGAPQFIRNVPMISKGVASQRTLKSNKTMGGKIAQRFATQLYKIFSGNAGGFVTENFIGCQWDSETHGGKTVLLYNRKTGEVKAAFKDNADDSITGYANEYGYKVFGILMHFLGFHDDEYREAIDELYNDFRNIKNPDSDNLSDDGKNALVIACDSIYRQAVEEGESYFKCEVNDLASIPSMTDDDFKVKENVIYRDGNDDLFTFESSTPNDETTSDEPVLTPGSYSLGDREFTAFEKQMMEVNKVSDSIVISKEAGEVAQCIWETSNDAIPARTFLFSGPAGNGKSTTAQCVAALINRPFIRQSLGPDSDKFDLLSSTQPRTDKKCEVNEAEVCAEAGIPTFVEMQFDVCAAYTALTGTDCSIENGQVVAGEDSYSKEDFIFLTTELWKVKFQNALSKIKGANDSDFLFVDSPIIQAAKYGWVVEIQEPTLVMNSGELGLLNSLLEEGVAYLPSGEVVKRHPDNVVIFTTNYGYEGCNALNQALRDRCRKELTFELPSEDILIERVMKRSGNSDKKMVKKMVEFINSMREFCQRQMIGDGEIGERSLINWAADVGHGHDPYKVAIENVINKAASDTDERATLIDFLNNSHFASTRKKTR